MIATHVHHAPSLTALQKARNGTLSAALCLHSLAECYSVLTAYPMNPMILPATAERLIQENILPFFKIIELGLKDYRASIERVRSLQLRSGAIYDALIFQAAIKSKSSQILSWNISDFDRLADGKIRIDHP